MSVENKNRKKNKGKEVEEDMARKMKSED